MDRDDYAVVRRFEDLSQQADRKGIVLFSNFLNMYEINLLHQNASGLATRFSLYGGYQEAERQMVAFQPDALYYDWSYPISCIRFMPVQPKFADVLSHRDVLGACMHLGIEREMLGDIVVQDTQILIFCVDSMANYLKEHLTTIKHTQMKAAIVTPDEVTVSIQYREVFGYVASNRLDAFVAEACKMSRAQSATYILSENVIINGKLITNHNHKISPEDIISLRGYGKLKFGAFLSTTKKGRIRISYQWYC